MKKQILIIKTGATGDVVRTSVLLHAFANDDVTWITARKNKAVLPQHFPALKQIISIEDVMPDTFKGKIFNLVLSLDDDKQSVEILSNISYKKLTGAFLNKEISKIEYTEDSASWFDLSLISRFPKEIADRKKYEATKSVQEYLYEMIGKKFNGEEYLIPEDILSVPIPKLIGIEERAGLRWETKRWNGYQQLAQQLEKEGYQIHFFEERKDIKDYMRDIAQCELIITGDTLGMHFALALKIPTVAIFTCTSPSEIYDYRRMEKVISPYLWEAFYKTTYIAQAVESVTQDMVRNAIEKVEKYKKY